MTAYTITTGEGHLADAELMQLLDGESTPDAARDHLGACGDCQDRLGRLRKAADLLRASLVDVPMPDLSLSHARARRPWLISLPVAAAATVVILASAAAATPAIRGWILRRMAPPTPSASVPITPPPAPVSTAGGGVIASFVPTDTTLTIRLDRRQTRGAIELMASATRRISVQALGPEVAQEILVLPAALRIVNMTTAGSYRIALPASVRTVRVIVGGDEVAVVRNEPGLNRRIELR